MDGQPTWTDCDEAGDYVVPNVLSPRDLVFRPDNMDETVPHTTHSRNYMASVRRDFLSLFALRIGCDVILWHFLCFPYNYFVHPSQGGST